MSELQNSHTTQKEQQFFFRQQACHENSGSNTFFVARDYITRKETSKAGPKEKTVKQYTSFPSYQDYAFWVKQFEPKDRNFYEQIKDNAPCWEYYDIDDWADKSISPKQLYNEFLDHRIAWGLEIGVNSERSKFTVLDSSKYNSDGELIKGSLHILSHNVSFPNNQQHNEFFKKFVAYLPSEFPRLDKSVYSKNRVFRLENNTKIGEYRPLKKPSWLIESGFTKPVPYIITVDVKPELYWTLDQETINERQRLKEERQIALEKLPRIDGLETIFSDIVAYIREGKHPKGDDRFNNTSLGYADWVKFTYAVKGALGMDFVEKHWDEIYYLYGHASETCVQSQLTSIMNAQIEPDTTSLMYWAKPIPKFQEEHPEHCTALNTIELPKDFKYAECKKMEIDGFGSVSYIDLLNKYDTVFVKGNMGCGKTEKIKSIVPLYSKIVFVSSKRSLAYDFHNKYPEFELYDDLKGTIDVDVHNKVIIQVDSLNRLIGQVDLFIIDEFIDLSSQLLSSRNRTESSDAFQVHLQFSNKRLIMDANLNRIDFFSELIDLDKSIFVKDNKIYHNDKHIIEHSNKDQFTMDILAISNGRMFIPSDSKKFIDTTSQLYMKKYPERKVLILTSESSYDDRREDWNSYDVIFCSPTITAGVSHKTKIDHVYGYYTKRSINAWSATQQLLRCRNWAHANIFFGSSADSKDDLPVNDSELEKWITDRFNTEITDVEGLKINRIKKTIDKTFMYYMYIENLKRTYRSKKFFRYYFLKIMREHGVKSTVSKQVIDETKLESIQIQKKVIEYESKEALIKAITTAQPTEEDMSNFKAHKFDHIDKATLEVILMTETYGFCPRTEEEVRTYMGKRKIYKNICKTVQDIDTPTELSSTNYSNLDIKDQNDIQRRTVCNMILKTAGFTGLVDKNTISINEKLGEFVQQNLEKIQTIFNSHKTVTLESSKNLMCFVNSKLEDVYGVKLDGKKKQVKGVRSQVYNITGMDLWTENQGEGKPCITNKLQSILRD
jgi:hypothetical protein